MLTPLPAKERHPLSNFVEVNVCEYALLYPTVEAMVRAFLYKSGSDYKTDKVTAEIYQLGPRGGRRYLHKTPRKTPDQLAELSEALYREELRDMEQQYSRLHAETYRGLLAQVTKGPVWQIGRTSFTASSMLNDIELFASTLKAREDTFKLRPEPLSEGAGTYQVTEKSPVWLIETALALSQAWQTYLTRECLVGSYGSTKGYADEYFTKRFLMQAGKEVERLQDILDSRHDARPPHPGHTS